MRSSHSQSGSMIFMIFVAAALFAALGFAITANMRSTQDSTSKEEANLAATEVLDYATAIGSAVEEMLLLRGVADTNTGENGILFASPLAHSDYGVAGTQPHTELFHMQGGRGVYQKPASFICIQSCAYEFTGQMTVTGVGTSRAELAMVLAGVRSDVCQVINKMSNTGWQSTPNGPALVLERFDGTNYGNATANPITLTGGADEFVGKRVFCYRESAGTMRNVFVQVLKGR